MNVQLFKNESFGEVRVSGTSEEPLFCLADICKVLDLQNPSTVKNRLDAEDVQLIDLHALNYTEGMNGNSKANFVTESGFYDVILQSSSPKVKPFRKWVTSEVLPSIRKTGGYIASSEEDTPEIIMARAILVAQETIKKKNEKLKDLEHRNRILEPKAELMDKILDTDQKIDIGQAAKILQLSFGRNTMFRRLREKGIFFKNRNEPKQEYIDRGYSELKEKYIDRNNHDGFTVIKVLVTQKGLDFLAKMFEVVKSKKQLALIK